MADIYILPTTSDGERTFSCTLGQRVYNFRTYWVRGIIDLWYIDILDSDLRPLAVGRRLITGSINILTGFANDLLLDIALVVYDETAVPYSDEALGVSLNGMWFSDRTDNPLKNGDPMDTLYEQFYIAQDTV